MMQLQYKGEFLDLAPGQDGELTRNSPLFGLDQILAEYSTPVSFVYTDKNARLLGFVFFDLTVKVKQKIDVDVFNAGTYRYRATFVIEGAGMNRVFAGKSNATGYLLTGISDFFALVKDKKLTDLALGGMRAYTDAMFKNTLNFTDDFVCQPTRNEYWDGNDEPGSAEWMNQLRNDGNLSDDGPVAPFVKIEYLLREMFAESGWTLDTTGINDADWHKLILFTAARIDRVEISYVYSAPSGYYLPTRTLISPVYFTLNKMMPAGVTIPEFITAICSRYGWAPVCNADQRTCYLTALKDAPDGTVKDWTQYSAQSSSSDFSSDARVFQYNNTFEGGDQFPSEPSFEGLTLIAASFADRSQLPAVSNTYNSYYDDKYAYTALENQYWKVEMDVTTNMREWVVLADNIYNKTVEDASDTVETKCTTLPHYLTIWRTENGVDYYGYFPTCRQSRFEKWGIRTLLYHGRVKEQKSDRSVGTTSYPFASGTSIPPNTLALLNWSNVFSHITGQTDKGIVPYWYSRWTQVLSNGEKIKRRYNLPLHVWSNFRWTDVILDNGKQYLVRSATDHINYKNLVECTLQPLLLDNTSAALGIWLSIGFENVVHTSGEYVTWYVSYQNADHGEVVIRAWADAAGTIPYTPNNLTAKYAHWHSDNNAGFVYDWETTIKLNAHKTVVYADALKKGYFTYSGALIEVEYRLGPDPAYSII